MSQKERYAGLIGDYEYLGSCIRDLKACINRYDEDKIVALDKYSQKESNLRNHIEYYAREILRDLLETEEKELVMPAAVEELEDFADLI